MEEEMSNGALSVDEMDDKDEVVIRRMKNRERQRRYRERKRMRGDVGIDDLSFEEEPKMAKLEQVELQECNGYVDNFARRVYCGRDWKKEARIAHLMMDKSHDGMVIWKIKPCRRNWKAEARMKKT